MNCASGPFRIPAERGGGGEVVPVVCVMPPR
ncbi:hypothetical protein SFR_3821 [Streptomyces sp. FR-008]|nr:hypothetical protein SFR_3821 [Streptomyces sp. FR-008]